MAAPESASEGTSRGGWFTLPAPFCQLFAFTFAVAPELQEALAYALRYISQNRSADPIRVCAEKLLEFHAQLHPEPAPLPSSGSGETADSTEADDEQAKLRTMARGRGRRQVVFSEPVKLDGAWTPVVVPKSEEERAEIAAVLQKNILFAAMDDDQRRILIDAMVKSGVVTGGGPGRFCTRACCLVHYRLARSLGRVWRSSPRATQGTTTTSSRMALPKFSSMAGRSYRREPFRRANAHAGVNRFACVSAAGRQGHGLRRACSPVRRASCRDGRLDDRSKDVGHRPRQLQAGHDWDDDPEGEWLMGGQGRPSGRRVWRCPDAGSCGCCWFRAPRARHPSLPACLRACVQRELYEGFLRAVPIFGTLTHDEVLTIADTLQTVRRRRRCPQ